ncbi:MAG: glycosyltransferase [Microthrixaceae bacterium]|nr:glycosyltransferase [Microthrixaceae bacterium]
MSPRLGRSDATVTVIIPCYNYARFLTEAIQSALTQERVKVSVIVVDDASTDESVRVARAIADNDTRVRVLVNEQNQGAVATFNRGLAEAKGEFIVRLDADDVLTPGSLARATAVLQALPDVGLVYGHPLHFSGAQRPTARVTPTVWALWDGHDWLQARCAAATNVITSPEVVMRKSVVDVVGGQRPLAHAHDFEMWMRIAAHADVAYIRGADQAWHREHSSSLSNQAAAPVTILTEIRDAFDVLFDELAQGYPGRESLHAVARRAVALQAIANARRAADHARVSPDAVALLALAEECDAGIVRTRQWRSANRVIAAAVRRSPARVIAGIAPRMQRRIQDRTAQMRWNRTGMYEPLRTVDAGAHSHQSTPSELEGKVPATMDAQKRLFAKVRRAMRVGAGGLAQRAAQRAYRSTGAADLRFNLDLADVLTEVPGHLPTPATSPEIGTPLQIGWVMTPPAAGSGGHTTIFRMVESLQDRGHKCVLYIYDKHGLDLSTLESHIRQHWPHVRAEVRDARRGIRDIDAVVATSWESAHVIVKYGASAMHRLYFIQDFEPYFYAHGAEYEFAAMTYRLPFRRIALGEMLDGMIREATGLTSDVVPFGCDSSVYRLPEPAVQRSGIVYFCRPDAPRRGYELACVTLRLFHQMHPEQEIHVFGSAPRGLGVPVTFHGRLRTDELNALYGRTVAGLAMSFTNITLVAEEMLGAGNIPIVNDLRLAHDVLPNPHVRWAEPTAAALAAALSAAVNEPDIAGKATAAAASVVGRTWQPTRDAVVRIIESEVYQR